jgi:hypothetical protein
LRNPPSCFAVDAVPNVAGRIIGKRANHKGRTIARLACYLCRPGRHVESRRPTPVCGGASSCEPASTGSCWRRSVCTPLTSQLLCDGAVASWGRVGARTLTLGRQREPRGMPVNRPPRRR